MSNSIYYLLQPYGGFIRHIQTYRSRGDEPRLITQTTELGDIRYVLAHVHNGCKRSRVSGAGVGKEKEDSILPALGEALERYCACAFTREQFIVATAKELGKDALDLDMIPRCSEKELAHPDCPLTAPDKNAPIRWVRALSLLDGNAFYVPAVMVYLYTGFAAPSERLCFPITTGCAAGTSYERALLSGILEVIERDAISIVWLQKLSLPRIEIDDIPQPLSSYWARYQQSSQDLEYIFFDATTDLGIPIVYALQIAKSNPLITTLVSCSSSLDPSQALAKVICDMAAARVAFRYPRPTPDNWQEFTDIFHGASYMGQLGHLPAFNFLLNSEQKRPLSKMANLTCSDEKQSLQMVLSILRHKGLNAYAVDLSTDEALRVGLRVVRIIIPGLQPVGFQYRARYLGHSRLYEAPRRMGYHSYPEEQLNHWPQPFA